MGGYVEVIDPDTKEGTGIAAQPVDLKVIDRSELRDSIIAALKNVNELFKKRTDHYLWVNFSKVIESGEAFNGSSRWFMDPNMSDETYLKHKPIMGDIDVMIPDMLPTEVTSKEDIVKAKEDMKETVFNFLASIKGKKLSDKITYLGTNRKQAQGTSTIIGVFEFDNGTNKVNFQMDFEMMPYEGEEPHEFSKFSHSSSWEDIEEGLKGLAHKFAIINLARTISADEHAAEATDPVIKYIDTGVSSSDFDMKSIPRFSKLYSTSDKVADRLTNLAFTVDHGIRNKYEPLVTSDGKLIKAISPTSFEFIDFEDSTEMNAQVKKAGKILMRPLATGNKSSDAGKKQSVYKTQIDEIYFELFKEIPDTEKRKKFNSYVGILSLVKHYFKDRNLLETFWENMLDNIFGSKAQPIDPIDKGDEAAIQKDYITRSKILEKFIDIIGVGDMDIVKQKSIQYYSKYRVNESLKPKKLKDIFESISTK